MKRLLALALVVAAACGRGGPGGSRPTPTLLQAPSPTGAAAARTDGTTTAAPATTPTPKPTGAAGKATAGTGPETPLPAGGPPLPAAGTYRFHDTGTRRAGSAGQAQPYEVDGTLTVVRSGAEVTLRFESSEGKEEARQRHTPDRVLLTYVRLEQGIIAFEGTFDPPQVVLRWPVRVGDTWENRWRTSDTQGVSRFRVLRQETLTALGRSWLAFVIESETDATGEAQGNTTATAWYVPDLGLDLKRVSDFRGSYRGVPFERHSERLVTATP